jgi:hypothetical protein
MDWIALGVTGVGWWLETHAGRLPQNTIHVTVPRAHKVTPPSAIHPSSIHPSIHPPHLAFASSSYRPSRTHCSIIRAQPAATAGVTRAGVRCSSSSEAKSQSLARTSPLALTAGFWVRGGGCVWRCCCRRGGVNGLVQAGSNCRAWHARRGGV